jgi:hypothetical protein
VGRWRNKEGGNKKFPDANENENATYQNLWDITKIAVRGKWLHKKIRVILTK